MVMVCNAKARPGYSTLGQGIGYRKAEEAHKEGGNIAAQVVTKCGCVLGVTTLFVTYVILYKVVNNY